MTIDIVPINGFIGAEIRGADLSRLDDAMFGVLHDALVRYEVIVLREQRITLEQQMAFGARFGPLSVHPFSPNMPDKPEVIVLDYSEDHPASRTDIWHADETFRDNPPMGTMLRARVVPDRGGDTCFASMTAAYRGLSERMKAHLHGLEALHDFKPFRTLFNNTPPHRKRLRETMSIPEAKGGGMQDVANVIMANRIILSLFAPNFEVYDRLSQIDKSEWEVVEYEGLSPQQALEKFTADQANFRTTLKQLAASVSKSAETVAL